MSHDAAQTRNRAVVWAGLGGALLIAVLLSPFASSKPDGLNRVAQDLKFEHKAVAEAPAHKLPFYQVFHAYKLRGAPEGVATPIAGVIGTLVTFGLAWGLGKVVLQRSPAEIHPESSDHSEP